MPRFLALATLLALALPLRAQSWPTTNWILLCGVEGIALSECDEVADPQSAHTAVQGELQRASEWLRGLGFRAPSLPLREGRYPALVTSVDFGEGTLAQYTTAREPDGTIVSRTMNLRSRELSNPGFFANGQVQGTGDALELNYELLATPVHELFHAITGSYGAPMPDALDWVTEGTAEAVMYRWLEHENRPFSFRARRYDLPLNESEDGGYDLSHFWYHLGKEIGSADPIGYLHGFLEAEYPSGDGIAWLDGRLADQDGLAKVFPRLLGTHARDAYYYERVEPVTLAVGIEEDERRTTVPRLASRAFEVEVRAPSGDAAGVEFRFAEDHPDLHLVVEGDVYDEETDLAPRNVFRAAISGGEPQTFFVQVVNVAEEAASTADREVTVEFVLKDLDPCSGEYMAGAINSQLFATGAMRPEVFDEDGVYAPGASELTFSGLVNTGGTACTFNIGEVSIIGAALSGEISQAETEAAMRARAAEMEAQMATLDVEELERKAAAGTLTEADMRRMMGIASQAEDVLATPGDEATTVLHVFSPHLVAWQVGMLSHPWVTGHGGLSGWRPNSAGHVFVAIPGVGARQLRAGQTYPAVALAMEPESETPPTMGAPSPIGFYTDWNGTFQQIPYPRPRSAEEARRQAEDKAGCRQALAEFNQIIREMEASGALLGRPPTATDCNYRGLAFQGESRILFGDLEGTVTVEAVTGGVVTGRFELSGGGGMAVETSRFTYTDGVLDGDEQETEIRPGPVSIRGTFAAPSKVGGAPHGMGMRTVTLENARRR